MKNKIKTKEQLTVEGLILECNTAGAKMFGYTKEDRIKHWYFLL